MFKSIVPVLSQVPAEVCLGQQNRGMATLKAIQIRLKSVKNIQKITQSMKMVSAAKYSRAERDLKQARPYGVGAQQFYEKAEVVPKEDDNKKLFIAITSDRGLCGAVHTGVARYIRGELAKDPNIKVICVGDKSRAILSRLYGKNIEMVANEVGRLPPTFLDAAKLCNAILNLGYEYTDGKIIYNKFKSVVSYSVSDIPIFSLKSVESAEKLPVYDSLDSEVVQSYLEFSLASLLFYTMKEGTPSANVQRTPVMGRRVSLFYRVRCSSHY